MKTICYIASLFCIVAALALAVNGKWAPAAFWMSTAIWLNQP